MDIQTQTIGKTKMKLPSNCYNSAQEKKILRYFFTLFFAEISHAFLQLVQKTHNFSMWLMPFLHIFLTLSKYDDVDWMGRRN